MSRHSRPTRTDVRAGLRNMASAAAAAGGVLAVVTPMADLDGPERESSDGFRLAADAAATSGAPQQAGPALTVGEEVVRASGLLAVTDRAAQAREAGAQRARAEAEQVAARAGDRPGDAGVSATGGDCDLDTGGLGEVRSWVRDAAQFLGCAFGRPELLGIGQRGSASDHPAGKALDLMTTDQARGDAIAECALANADELGVDYVIWRQRMSHGDGWQAMENRGDATANHMDHVHISFGDRAGSGDPDLGRCA